jgi:hypothetical protein
MSAVSFYIMMLVLSFIAGGILHILAIIGGAKKGFANTYKAYAYASTPTLLLSWIILLISLSIDLFSGIASPIPFTFFGSLALIPIGICMLYLMARGLSVLHEISMKRAAAIVLIPLIAVLLLLLILLFMGMAAPFLPSFNYTNSSI